MDEHLAVDEHAAAARAVVPAGAVAGSCAAMGLLGLLASAYGPVIPALRDRFALGPSAAGLVLSAHFVGALLGVLVVHRAQRRIGLRALLVGSGLLMAVGGVALAVAPSREAVLAAALVAGLGFGGLDYGLNHLFTIAFGDRGIAMLNLINAFFGIGAILGPAAVGLLGAQRYPLLFLVFAAATAAVTPALARLRPGAVRAPERMRQPAGGGARVVVAVFVVFYVLHVGIESGVGGWEPSHLEAVGYGATAAAAATSAFWFMLTAGRLALVLVGRQLDAAVVVGVCCVGMTVSSALAGVPALAPYAYAAVGLFVAPLFPTGLVWLHRLVPQTRGAGAYVIAASMIGGVAFPPVMGLGIEAAGIFSVPVSLAATAAVCVLAVGWVLMRSGGRAGSSSAHTGPRPAGRSRSPQPR